MKSSKDISLSPKWKRMVARKVASGRFSSPKHVIEEALSLLDAREREFQSRIESINAGIDRGLSDARAGRETDFDDAAVERINRRGRARLALERQRKSA